jgi:hypothetical protein
MYNATIVISFIALAISAVTAMIAANSARTSREKLRLGVKTKSDFQNLLNAANSLDSKFGKVQSVSLFSHAGDINGPVFHDQSGHPSQFMSISEISGLHVNWSSTASALFYGCNTAANFAQDFADAQRVPAYGYEGYASFSGSRNTVSKWYVLDPYNIDLYLVDKRGTGLERHDPDEPK